MLKYFLNSRITKYVYLTTISLASFSCEKSSQVVNKASAPFYWVEPDDFAQMDAHYLNTTLEIDSAEGQYLDLQFQCFRHKGAQISIEQNLIVNSKADMTRPGSMRRYIDAVLYKNEGMPAQIYRDHNLGIVPFAFQDASLNLGEILSMDSRENYRGVQLRFVYGASPQDAQNADVGALSRAASVDFNLSPADPEVGKFMRACAPVKNWTPPKT